MRINLARALNLASDDGEGWKKAAIFAAICAVCQITGFLIIPALFLLLYMPGYTCQVVRNTATGENNSRLPEPANAGGVWHGFMLMLIGIVYSLPLMGVMAVGFGGAIVAMAQGARTNSSLMAASSVGALGLFGLVACLLGLVIAVLAPMVLLQYCKRFQFGDAFNFAEVFAGMMRSPVDYLVILVLGFVLNLVGAMTAMIPFVGAFVSGLVNVMVARLIGQYGATVLDMYVGGSEPADVGFSRF